MLFILHTVPVALSADYKLIRNFVLFTLETLNIQAVTRVLVWREDAKDCLGYFVDGKKGRVGLVTPF